MKKLSLLLSGLLAVSCFAAEVTTQTGQLNSTTTSAANGNATVAADGTLTLNMGLTILYGATGLGYVLADSTGLGNYTPTLLALTTNFANIYASNIVVSQILSATTANTGTLYNTNGGYIGGNVTIAGGLGLGVTNTVGGTLDVDGLASVGSFYDTNNATVAGTLTNGAFHWTGSTGVGYVLQDSAGNGSLSMAAASGGSSSVTNLIFCAGGVNYAGAGLSSSAYYLDPFGQPMNSGSGEGLSERYLSGGVTMTNISFNWSYPANTTNAIILNLRSNNTTVVSFTNNLPVNGAGAFPPQNTNIAFTLYLPAGTEFSMSATAKVGAISPAWFNWIIYRQ